MADGSTISGEAELPPTGRTLGAHKSAARKAGCTVEEWWARRTAGERWCYRCVEWKALSGFSKDRSRTGGYAPICKPCNSQRSLRCKYGLSEQEMADLRAPGACPICDRSGVPMEIDHNHTTGTVRAVLCSRCNSALGLFCESPALMLRAIAYLAFHDAADPGRLIDGVLHDARPTPRQ